MSLQIITRVTLAILIVATTTYVLNSSNASAGLKGTRILDQTGCCKRCPACDHVCNLDAEIVDEEKTCFEVETKVICIPRVVFPWQKKSCGSCDSCDGAGCKKCKLLGILPWHKKNRGSCDSCDGVGCSSCSSCPNNGARTRKVCVLTTKKYKCQKCEYTWTAEEKPCGPCATACDAGSCDQASCDATPWMSKPLTYGEVDTQEVAVEPVPVSNGELPAPSAE